METSYQAVIWSAINLKLLCALWEITAEDGGIPVQLGYEPDNPADSKAVIVTISTYTLRCRNRLAPYSMYPPWRGCQREMVWLSYRPGEICS